jgi:hypothetical protein
MWRRKMHTGFGWEKPKGNRPLGDLDTAGR